MGQPAARKGDICTGHGCWPPRSSISGCSKVMIEGKQSHGKGDLWNVHCCPKLGCHPSVLCQGSQKVVVCNKQQGRRLDPVCCGSKVLGPCAQKVIVG